MQENLFEYVVSKMVAISTRTQCVISAYAVST